MLGMIVGAVLGLVPLLVVREQLWVALALYKAKRGKRPLLLFISRNGYIKPRVGEYLGGDKVAVPVDGNVYMFAIPRVGVSGFTFGGVNTFIATDVSMPVLTAERLASSQLLESPYAWMEIKEALRGAGFPVGSREEFVSRVKKGEIPANLVFEVLNYPVNFAHFAETKASPAMVGSAIVSAVVGASAIRQDLLEGVGRKKLNLLAIIAVGIAAVVLLYLIMGLVPQMAGRLPVGQGVAP